MEMLSEEKGVVFSVREEVLGAAGFPILTDGRKGRTAFLNSRPGEKGPAHEQKKIPGNALVE